jgi:hypothetical protein
MSRPLFEPVEAMVAGVATAWGRVFLFFGAAMLGHAIGMVGANTLVGEPFAINLRAKDLAFVPVSLIFQMFQNFLFGFGALYLVALAACFYRICFSERSLGPTVFLVLLQLWDTFLIVRDWASTPSFFHLPPEFSAWGTAFVITVSLPLLLLLVHTWRRSRDGMI